MTSVECQWSPGSLVKARGREWLVLPDSSDDLLLLRPIGGLDEEAAGVIPSILSLIHI